MNVKTFLKRLAARFGYRIINDTSDEILTSMLLLYDELRLNPNDFLNWDHSLSSLASESRLRTMLHSQKPDLLLDVGANRGQFATSARRAGYNGKIFSFEPQASMQEYLKKASSGDENWTILDVALGNTNSTAKLNVFDDDTFSSLLELAPIARESFGEMLSLRKTEVVEVRKLDDILASMGIDSAERIFLKSDTQGNELGVLNGACETLSSTVSVLVEATMEPLYVNASQFDEINKFLLPLGFKHAGMFPIGYKPSEHTLLELDCYYSK